MINIYLITNKTNNKVYIGQTIKTIKHRFMCHKNPSSECIKLVNAFNKYGRENFYIELLGICQDQLTADALEIFWIKTFDSIKNGYNIREGGSGSPMSNRTHSQETKDRIAKARKGKSHLKGEKHPRSKLIWNEVKEIRQKYSTGKYTMQELAVEYKVCKQTVSLIVRNKIWQQ